MTKGTTRRERKYRKKAVSVCTITSTSSTANGVPKSANIPHPEPGLLLSTNTTRTSTGTPSGSQIPTPNNAFPPTQPPMTKV